MTATWRQDEQQKNRDPQGRYAKGPRCAQCGRPAGHDYGSGPVGHPFIDLVLCAREECLRSAIDQLVAEGHLAADEAERFLPPPTS